MAQLFDLKFKIRSIKIRAGLISGRSAARFLIAMWRAPELARACARATSDLREKKRRREIGRHRFFFFFFARDQRAPACMRHLSPCVPRVAAHQTRRHATCVDVTLRAGLRNALRITIFTDLSAVLPFGIAGWISTSLDVNGGQAGRRIVIRHMCRSTIHYMPASCTSHSATARDSLAQNSIMATVVLGYSLNHC